MAYGTDARGDWLKTGWRDSAAATPKLPRRNNDDRRHRDTKLLRMPIPAIVGLPEWEGNAIDGYLSI